ncbi:MAG: hypothetical protein KDC70_16350, partial [Saprospiraceae bacterium]|nr:hypothetical protein [Saprospiraceae bacterium]
MKYYSILIRRRLTGFRLISFQQQWNCNFPPGQATVLAILPFQYLLRIFTAIMNFLPAHRLRLYRNFKAIESHDFHGLIRFYEQF